jgi:hypothetical protein
MTAPGPAYAARLARFLKRRLARRTAAAPQPADVTPPALTIGQKTASHPRLRRTCVAQMQHNSTVQENNHARLL